MLQHFINHVALVVDRSGSMAGQPVVKVFDASLERLKSRSVELDQETRISIYLFNERIECLAFDMDVMRFKTLDSHWNPAGGTALIDATVKAIEDQKLLPETYGDHAFLLYDITDGAENRSRHDGPYLRSCISMLKDNWTVACLVPDADGKHEAKKFGFPADSVAVWNTSSAKGLEDVGKQFNTVMDNYMAMRKSGVRGTKGLFTLDSSGLSRSVAKAVLQELPVSEYEIFPVRKDAPIKEFVESWTKSPYRLGSAYYQPTKTVKIQDYKGILVQDIKNGRVYEGQYVRQALGLPHATAEVNPGQHKDWRVFVQSTSVNRKVFQDTFLLLRK